MCLALNGLTTVFVIGRRRLMFFSTACMVLAQAAVAGLSSDLTTFAVGCAAIVLLHGHVHSISRHVHDPIHVRRRSRSIGHSRDYRVQRGDKLGFQFHGRQSHACRVRERCMAIQYFSLPRLAQRVVLWLICLTRRPR